MKCRWSPTEKAEYVEEEENGVLGNDINPGGLRSEGVKT